MVYRHTNRGSQRLAMGFSILSLLTERVWLTGTLIRDGNRLREYQANLHGYSHPVCDPRHPSHKQWGTSETKHAIEQFNVSQHI